MYKFEQSKTNPSFQFCCLNSRLKVERSPLSWQIFIRGKEWTKLSLFFFFFFFFSFFVNNGSLRVSNRINNVSGPINFWFCCHRGTKNILQEYVHASSRRGHLLKQAVKSIITFHTYSKRGNDTCYFSDWNRVKWKLTRVIFVWNFDKHASNCFVDLYSWNEYHA